MRKYWLLLLSLTASTSVYAMNANEQMDAVKGLFINEFNQIDTDKDGKISKDEYLAHQFNNLRNNVLSSSGFSSENKEEPAPVAKVESKPEVKDTPTAPQKVSEDEMGKIPEALKAMAEFDIDLDDIDAKTDFSLNKDKEEPDVEIEEVEDEDILKAHKNIDLDLSVSEDENLQNLLKEMEEETSPSAIADINPEESLADTLQNDTKEKDKQIVMMMNTIRKTLPKKIDAITTWTDITYKNSTISYVYKADMDTSKFTDAEKASLEMSIKNEACFKAYTDMCPKVKPMFIDEGINVEIRYFDNNGTELSSCQFNHETCGN